LRLQNAQRLQLDQFLDRLEDIKDATLAREVMAGPITKDIYKLRIGGKVRLRPMVCFGPCNPGEELTLLCPATERDGKLDPGDAPETAQIYRKAILSDARRRRPLDRPIATRWNKAERKKGRV